MDKTCRRGEPIVASHIQITKKGKPGHRSRREEGETSGTKKHGKVSKDGTTVHCAKCCGEGQNGRKCTVRVLKLKVRVRPTRGETSAPTIPMQAPTQDTGNDNEGRSQSVVTQMPPTEASQTSDNFTKQTRTLEVEVNLFM